MTRHQVAPSKYQNHLVFLANMSVFLFSDDLPLLSSALCVTHGRPKGLLKIRGLAARSTQHLAHSTEHLVPSTQHLAPSAKHTARGTQHLAPVSYTHLTLPAKA